MLQISQVQHHKDFSNGYPSQLSQLSLSFCLLKLTDAPDDSLLKHGGDLPRIVLCTVRAFVYFHAERILIRDENTETNKQSNKLHYYVSCLAIWYNKNQQTY